MVFVPRSRPAAAPRHCDCRTCRRTRPLAHEMLRDAWERCGRNRGVPSASGHRKPEGRFLPASPTAAEPDVAAAMRQIQAAATASTAKAPISAPTSIGPSASNSSRQPRIIEGISTLAVTPSRAAPRAWNTAGRSGPGLTDRSRSMISIAPERSSRRIRPRPSCRFRPTSGRRRLRSARQRLAAAVKLQHDDSARIDKLRSTQDSCRSAHRPNR